MTLQVLKTILYFDVFDHPLARDEIISYCSTEDHKEQEIDLALKELMQENLISRSHGYYFVYGKSSNGINKREQANDRYHQRLKTARLFSRLISWFPFVRGVFLSGSISKGVMKADDDIDYFIVTEPGRLWIARTMLILFKKLFLLNSYRNFCINYFVDTHHLHIHEHNRFTATETVFLLPVFNKPLYLQMLRENEWVKHYYPCFIQDLTLCRDGEPLLKKGIEKLFNLFGEKLDTYLFRKSDAFIRRKFSYKGKDEFNSNFSIKKTELRFLPSQQQHIILEKYREKLRQATQYKNMTYTRAG